MANSTQAAERAGVVETEQGRMGIIEAKTALVRGGREEVDQRVFEQHKNIRIPLPKLGERAEERAERLRQVIESLQQVANSPDDYEWGSDSVDALNAAASSYHETQVGRLVKEIREKTKLSEFVYIGGFEMPLLSKDENPEQQAEKVGKILNELRNIERNPGVMENWGRYVVEELDRLNQNYRLSGNRKVARIIKDSISPKIQRIKTTYLALIKKIWAKNREKESKAKLLELRLGRIRTAAESVPKAAEIKPVPERKKEVEKPQESKEVKPLPTETLTIRSRNILVRPAGYEFGLIDSDGATQEQIKIATRWANVHLNRILANARKYVPVLDYENLMILGKIEQSYQQNSEITTKIGWLRAIMIVENTEKLRQSVPSDNWNDETDEVFDDLASMSEEIEEEPIQPPIEVEEVRPPTETDRIVEGGTEAAEPLDLTELAESIQDPDDEIDELFSDLDEELDRQRAANSENRPTSPRPELDTSILNDLTKLAEPVEDDDNEIDQPSHDPVIPPTTAKERMLGELAKRRAAVCNVDLSGRPYYFERPISDTDPRRPELEKRASATISEILKRHRKETKIYITAKDWANLKSVLDYFDYNVEIKHKAGKLEEKIEVNENPAKFKVKRTSFSSGPSSKEGAKSGKKEAEVKNKNILYIDLGTPTRLYRMDLPLREDADEELSRKRAINLRNLQQIEKYISSFQDLDEKEELIDVLEEQLKIVQENYQEDTEINALINRTLKRIERLQILAERKATAIQIPIGEESIDLFVAHESNAVENRRRRELNVQGLQRINEVLSSHPLDLAESKRLINSIGQKLNLICENFEQDVEISSLTDEIFEKIKRPRKAAERKASMVQIRINEDRTPIPLFQADKYNPRETQKRKEINLEKLREINREITEPNSLEESDQLMASIGKPLRVVQESFCGDAEIDLLTDQILTKLEKPRRLYERRADMIGMHTRIDGLPVPLFKPHKSDPAETRRRKAANIASLNTMLAEEGSKTGIPEGLYDNVIRDLNTISALWNDLDIAKKVLEVKKNIEPRVPGIRIISIILDEDQEVRMNLPVPEDTKTEKNRKQAENLGHLKRMDSYLSGIEDAPQKAALITGITRELEEVENVYKSDEEITQLIRKILREGMVAERRAATVMLRLDETGESHRLLKPHQSDETETGKRRDFNLRQLARLISKDGGDILLPREIYNEAVDILLELYRAWTGDEEMVEALGKLLACLKVIEDVKEESAPPPSAPGTPSASAEVEDEEGNEGGGREEKDFSKKTTLIDGSLPTQREEEERTGRSGAPLPTMGVGQYEVDFELVKPVSDRTTLVNTKPEAAPDPSSDEAPNDGTERKETPSDKPSTDGSKTGGKPKIDTVVTTTTVQIPHRGKRTPPREELMMSGAFSRPPTESSKGKTSATPLSSRETRSRGGTVVGLPPRPPAKSVAPPTTTPVPPTAEGDQTIVGPPPVPPVPPPKTRAVTTSKAEGNTNVPINEEETPTGREIGSTEEIRGDEDTEPMNVVTQSPTPNPSNIETPVTPEPPSDVPPRAEKETLRGIPSPFADTSNEAEGSGTKKLTKLAPGISVAQKEGRPAKQSRATTLTPIVRGKGAGELDMTEEPPASLGRITNIPTTVAPKPAAIEPPSSTATLPGVLAPDRKLGGAARGNEALLLDTPGRPAPDTLALPTRINMLSALLKELEIEGVADLDNDDLFKRITSALLSMKDTKRAKHFLSNVRAIYIGLGTESDLERNRALNELEGQIEAKIDVLDLTEMARKETISFAGTTNEQDTNSPVTAEPETVLTDEERLARERKSFAEALMDDIDLENDDLATLREKVANIAIFDKSTAITALSSVIGRSGKAKIAIAENEEWGKDMQEWIETLGDDLPIEKSVMERAEEALDIFKRKTSINRDIETNLRKAINDLADARKAHPGKENRQWKPLDEKLNRRIEQRCSEWAAEIIDIAKENIPRALVALEDARQAFPEQEERWDRVQVEVLRIKEELRRLRDTFASDVDSILEAARTGDYGNAVLMLGERQLRKPSGAMLWRKLAGEVQEIIKAKSQPKEHDEQEEREAPPSDQTNEGIGPPPEFDSSGSEGPSTLTMDPVRHAKANVQHYIDMLDGFDDTSKELAARLREAIGTQPPKEDEGGAEEKTGQEGEYHGKINDRSKGTEGEGSASDGKRVERQREVDAATVASWASNVRRLIKPKKRRAS